MNVEEAIMGRRSIRSYTGEAPNEEEVLKVIEAGTWAPSGLNNQPWKFMVVRDGKTRAGLARFTKYGRIIEGAPVAICVFLDTGTVYNRDKDVQAVGACIQNMLLRAYELGLGTCWLGEILNRGEEVVEYLGVDPACELMAVVSLGYPAGPAGEVSRKEMKSLLLE